MSFRIDDILQKESTRVHTGYTEQPVERPVVKPYCLSTPPSSILDKTLSDKPQYFYRSVSMPHANTKTNFETNWCHSERICKNYFEDYRIKGRF